MRKHTVIYYGLLCMLNTAFVHANGLCESNFACAQVDMRASVGPEVSPIVYSGSWDSWGTTIINFNTVSLSASPISETYPITFGTLNAANSINNIYIKAVHEDANLNNALLNGYYTLTDTSDSASHIGYGVTYTACDGTTQSITPPAALPAAFSSKSINMAGPDPACHPETGKPGNGAGELIFTLQPRTNNANTGSLAAGAYQDTLNIVVCTQPACTN